MNLDNTLGLPKLDKHVRGDYYRGSEQQMSEARHHLRPNTYGFSSTKAAGIGKYACCWDS